MSERLASLIERGDPRDQAGWESRLEADRVAAEVTMSPEQREISDVLLQRAAEEGALGFALTGSTGRRRRTPISDLDFHVVGRRPRIDDLPADVDVYAIDPERMHEKLLQGDDFVQWTLRFGLILMDTGPFQHAATLVIENDLWPDGSAKLDRVPELRELAARLIEMGDRDAAQDQVRATLTSAARGLLLLNDTFPLARSELPEQLTSAGLSSLATALERAIQGVPSLTELADDLLLVEHSQIATLR
jgi:hypothetical protein